MAPQRPLYHRFAWAFDLVVRDASAGRVRRLAALLRAHGVRPPARILDAGCGTGNYARALARLGYRVVGVDRAVRLLADARAKTVAAGPVFTRVRRVPAARVALPGDRLFAVAVSAPGRAAASSCSRTR